MLFTVTLRSANTSGEAEIVNRGPSAAGWATYCRATSGQVGGAESDERIAGSYDNNVFACSRYFFNFNTVNIPTNATIISAVLRVWLGETTYGDTDNASLIIVPSSPVNPLALDTNDFDNVTFADKGSLDITSITQNQYNDITITDLTLIQKAQVSTFALVVSTDFNNTTPTGRNDASIDTDDDTGYPQLLITYSVSTEKKNRFYFM